MHFIPARQFAATLVTCTVAPAAFGEFTEKNRSVNGTGETLPAKTVQLGLTELHYGWSDNLMLSLPPLFYFTGRGALEVRYKNTIAENWRWTSGFGTGPLPYPDFAEDLGFAADITTPFVQFSQDLGIDLGQTREHSLNAGLDIRLTRGVKDDGSRGHRLLADIRFEYDRYLGGNLYYAGVARQLPYVGVTWSWRVVHFGLVTSPMSYFIPLPYLYWRF